MDSRPKDQSFHCSNYTYGSVAQNQRPCRPQACVAETTSSANHATAATRNNSAQRVRTIPACAMAFGRLGRHNWPYLGASLPSNRHHALSQLSYSSPMWHASTGAARSFEETTRILAVVYCSMRSPLLPLLLLLQQLLLFP